MTRAPFVVVAVLSLALCAAGFCLFMLGRASAHQYEVASCSRSAKS